MKQLLVDVGNTRIKWCLVEEGTVTVRGVFVWESETLSDTYTKQWGNLILVEDVYVSNVAGERVAQSMSDWCVARWGIKVSFATVKRTECGVTNSYSDVNKLGIDRWLAMLAAWHVVKDTVCVIDSGSAITLEVIDNTGLHQGGLIAPGLALSRRALTEHTHALTAENREEHSLLANNTNDAISAGCYHLFVGGIRHMIEKVQQQYGMDIKFIVTGGDAEVLQAAFTIEMLHEPDLILHGLGLSTK